MQLRTHEEHHARAALMGRAYWAMYGMYVTVPRKQSEDIDCITLQPVSEEERRQRYRDRTAMRKWTHYDEDPE